MSWRAFCLSWVIALSVIACSSDRPPDTILDPGTAADAGLAADASTKLPDDTGTHDRPERDGSVEPALDGGLRDAGLLRDAGGRDGSQVDAELDAGGLADGGGSLEDGGAPEDAGASERDGAAGDAGAGDDAQVAEPFHCDGPGVSVARAALPVTLQVHDLTLTIRELSRDASFALCAVPPGAYPQALAAEQPVAGAFLVESDVEAFSAELTRSLSGDVLAALDRGGDALEPTLWRAFSGASPMTLDGAYMDLSERELGSTLRGPGFVYLRHLDAGAPAYALSVRPPAAHYVTGELIRFGFRLHTEQPQRERTVSLSQTACQARPVGPSIDLGNAPCGPRSTLARAASGLPQAGKLLAHATLDLTEGERAAAFFCPYAGVGEVSENLTFHEGSAPVLSVRARATLTCSPSLDLVLAADRLTATRYLHGPLVTSLAPYGTPLPYGELALTSQAWLGGLTAFGADGVWYTGLTAGRTLRSSRALSFEGAHNSALWAFSGTDYVASYQAPRLESREPGLEPIDGPYFAGQPGSLTVRSDAATVSTQAAALSALDVRFAAPAGLATELSFADAAADTVLITGSSGSAGTGEGFARWIRASDLPLDSGRRSLTLLSSEQAALLAEAPWKLTRLQVAFMNVSWDHERAIWPDGRIVPVAAGTVLDVDPAQLGPEPLQPAPCGELVTDAATGCQSGPREVLLVAAKHGVEMFSPVDGEYLGAFMIPGASEPDGFVHVVQGDTDHCLYATQHMKDHAGVLRYDTGGQLLDVNPLALASDVTPYGLLSSTWFAGQLWLVALGEGGIDMLGPLGESYTRYEPTLASRGVTIGPAGVYASGVLAGDTLGSIRRIWGDDDGNTHQEYFARDLAGPEQLVMDGQQLLVALAAEPAVAAYDFASGEALRFVDEVFSASAAPKGVFPLLDGRWLVAGEQLGVRVVVPGTHVRQALASEVLDDASYISRVCLP